MSLCSCGSGQYREPVHDARGIFVAYVCDACRDQRLQGYRPEIFTDADYDRKIFIDRVLGLEFATLREIVAILQRTYCQTLGVEFMHIADPAQKAWIQERIEGPDKEITFTREGKRAILNKLVESPVTVKTLAGNLGVHWEGDEVILKGPAEIVCRGEFIASEPRP